MQFSVTFRQMEATEALKSYARDRIGRIKKYFPDPISCHVVLSTERFSHRVDVNLQLHNGFKIAGKETTENMYSSIDLVSAKIERQVRRYKDKLRHHKVRDHKPLQIFHSVLEEASFDEMAEAGVSDAPTPEPTITREAFSAEPMSVSEAIMQLNLLDEQFHVFRNDETGQFSVIYRRGEGGYGLIEPPAA